VGLRSSGYLGIPLTIVDHRRLARLLGVGIDYAIQMQRARSKRGVGRPRRSPDAGDGAQPRALRCWCVTFDAIFAFGALRFAQGPDDRAFGLLLAVGPSR